jgi:hypothetical protein
MHFNFFQLNFKKYFFIGKENSVEHQQQRNHYVEH